MAWRSRGPGRIRRGLDQARPTGVIGTNKKYAHETVDALLEDLAAGRLPEPQTDDDLEACVAERAPEHVDYAGWERIDAHERALGEPQGRPRVKLTDVAKMLEVARGG